MCQVQPENLVKSPRLSVKPTVREESTATKLNHLPEFPARTDPVLSMIKSRREMSTKKRPSCRHKMSTCKGSPPRAESHSERSASLWLLGPPAPLPISMPPRCLDLSFVMRDKTKKSKYNFNKSNLTFFQFLVSWLEAQPTTIHPCRSQCRPDLSLSRACNHPGF